LDVNKKLVAAINLPLILDWYTICMVINTLGITAAVTAFMAIWFGHVAVRRIEYNAVKLLPFVLMFSLMGAALYLVTVYVASSHLQVMLGIVGTTFLWDAYELVRQQGRVVIGHAPANPANPRHSVLLAQPNSAATPYDLLAREPLGRMVSPEEAIALVTKKGKA
jgi:hypothetical protein